MNKHFIKNIEIKNFKCFENFKAEGFGRVNLIGGKNNVGKTAFMEACYLSQAKDSYALFSTLLEIETHRDIINRLLSNTSRDEDIRSLIKNNLDIEIFIQGKGGFIEQKSHEDNYEEWGDGLIKLKVIKNSIHIYTKYTKINVSPPFYDNETEAATYPEYPDIYKLSDLVNEIDINIDSLKKYFSLNFISPYSNSNQELENIIGDSKLRDKKYETLNKHLSEVFNVSSIDIIKNKPMLKSDGEYKKLSHFGQGIKMFINIISSILLL
jgi:AAA15 family ATPase/GTPase